MAILKKGSNIAARFKTDKEEKDMQFEFKKNIQFTKLIKTDGRLREFNFRKLGGSREGYFTIDVTDNNGSRLMFEIKKEAGAWILEEKKGLPSWVLQHEPVFHDLIEEELLAES
jgi:hypothetical protein